ncbi:16S rRNA (cytidine(1402)-2'-O)-methyltransferase [Nitrosococcus wardiae]|uniref:Ribosomal RNA small subunit methyltransferase I n=1 Tax=Nitrosococcus wardiae TaxID=1814290 RepID=A0A4P7BVX0_9GAMM|nr:16S rRNA (cytidine(1402)-2'-O)-methyltransferase [Nitrosococcus wardiae]QBQ53427.1 16S rRNA (cytidine(1402)-2'-O)-methyltransferase [Nitrosococcus wardiae]
MMADKRGTLYVVATPIGNLGDLSPRAQEILQDVDLIAAEDTRHSAGLLRHFGITTAMISLHEYNERQQAELLITRCQEGLSVALISDAGTPLISDPGYRVVRQARQVGISVVPVPGPCALVAALSVAGLPSDRFVFEGFLPAKSGARQNRLEQLADETRTLIFYEAPHRLSQTLQAMVEAFGQDREAVVARELTKRYETVHGDSLSALLTWAKQAPEAGRGELVLLVHGAKKKQDAPRQEALKVLLPLVAALPLKQAVALATEITGFKKNHLYQLALELRATQED